MRVKEPTIKKIENTAEKFFTYDLCCFKKNFFFHLLFKKILYLI